MKNTIARSVETRYQAVVYHGGSLLGLGRWATGRAWRDRRRAEAEGRRLRAACSKVCGGSPSIDIVTLEVYQ